MDASLLASVVATALALASVVVSSILLARYRRKKAEQLKVSETSNKVENLLYDNVFSKVALALGYLLVTVFILSLVLKIITLIFE